MCILENPFMTGANYTGRHCMCCSNCSTSVYCCKMNSGWDVSDYLYRRTWSNHTTTYVILVDICFKISVNNVNKKSQKSFPQIGRKWSRLMDYYFKKNLMYCITYLAWYKIMMLTGTDDGFVSDTTLQTATIFVIRMSAFSVFYRVPYHFYWVASLLQADVVKVAVNEILYLKVPYFFNLYKPKPNMSSWKKNLGSRYFLIFMCVCW